MSKPEWGTKRICQSCTTKFYDFGRTPITCPKCSAVFDPETLLKSRRNRPPAAVKSSKPSAPVLSEAKKDDPTDTADVEKNLDAEDEDESTIEDASELGEDDEETSKEVVPSKSGED